MIIKHIIKDPIIHNLNRKNMELVNLYLNLVAHIMAILISIKWMDGANYFILLADSHMRDIGKIINLKDMVNYLIKFHYILIPLIIPILIKYIKLINKDIGNIIKEI